MLRKRGYTVDMTPDVLHAGKFVDRFGIAVERSRLLQTVRLESDPTQQLHVVRLFCGVSFRTVSCRHPSTWLTHFANVPA